MQTIWVRTGKECRLTVAEVSGSDSVHVIDYIVWVGDLFVGNVKFCPVGHTWGIRLCPSVIVTQACLETIWAIFHSLSPHYVPEETDV